MGLTEEYLLNINILGCNFNDTVLYLVRILQNMRCRVLIRDMTRNHCLLSTIPRVEGIDPSNCVYNYAGVGYTFSHGDNNEYDTIVRLYDSDMIPFVNATTIIILDESKRAVDELVSLKWQEYCNDKREKCLVIKNYTGSIRHQFDELIKKIGIESVYQIPVDIKNNKQAVLSEYMEKYKFDGITRNYKDALSGIVKTIFRDSSYKEIDYALKNASEGSWVN